MISWEVVYCINLA